MAIKVPTPVGVEVDLGASLTHLAFSKRGAIDPAVYPNLGLVSSFWTPMYVWPGRCLPPKLGSQAVQGCSPLTMHPAYLWRLLQGPASPIPDWQHVHQWRYLPVSGYRRQPHCH